MYFFAKVKTNLSATNNMQYRCLTLKKMDPEKKKAQNELFDL